MAFRSRAIQQEKLKSLKKPRNKKIKKKIDNNFVDPILDLVKELPSANNIPVENYNDVNEDNFSILDMLPKTSNAKIEMEENEKAAFDKDMIPGSESDVNVQNINQIQENFDEFDNVNQEEQTDNIVVGENIVSKINKDTLKNISSYLVDLVEKDQDQREPWLQSVQEYKKFLGTNASISIVENATNNVFDKFKVVDTTMSTEILRISSIVISEMLPNEGCVGYSIDNPNDVIEEIAKEITDTINNYLLYDDEGFYPDYRNFVYSLLVYGCGVRKMYLDPLSKKIITRFVSPEDFLIDKQNVANGRITHIKYLTKREIIFNINKGVFVDNGLNYLNSSKEITDEAEVESNSKQENIDSKFMFYEVHDYLNISEFENDNDINDKIIKQMPLPYVVTICAKTLNIVSFVPNWKNDENFTRINPFFFYKCFSGLDEYGTSLVSLIGANAKVLTALSRAVLDNVALNIQPAGFMISNNIGQKENKKTTFDTSPGTFQQIDTGNMPLQEVFQQFQYNPPPAIVFDIMQSIKTEIKETSSIATMSNEELGQNIPATLSSIERKNKMLSSMMLSIHSSFTKEIQALYKALFPVESQNKNIKIKLTSNPSVEGSAQRLVKAQALLDMAMKMPETVNLGEVVKNYCEALGVDEKKIELLIKQDAQESEEKTDPMLEIQQRQMLKEEKELELKMMEIQTRQLEAQVRLKEIESKERIADKQLERDGYIAALEDQFRKLKLNQETYVADTKNLTNKEIETNKMMLELEKINAEAQNKDKILELKEKDRMSKEDLALLKMQTEEKEKEIKNELELDRNVLLENN